MAFQVCDPSLDCGDPANTKIYLAQSDDGSTWTPIPGFQPVAGSTPELIRRDDTLYLFDENEVRRYHLDTGQWDNPSPITITRSDGAQELFVAPSAIQDENGRIVLFYLVGQASGDPTRCSPGLTTCAKVFRSATEVAGSDGSSFTVDTGIRYETIITGMEWASDPDVFRGPDSYLIYFSRGQSVQALSSSTLKGSYNPVSDLPNGMLVGSGIGAAPAGHYDSSTGRYWTYIEGAPAGVSVIRRAAHNNLIFSLSEPSFTTVLAGNTFQGLSSFYNVGRPSFALNVP